MINVLVLCTGNSCRSVMGEALINELGKGRIKAFSAGSQPLGRINTNALKTLERHGIKTDGVTSQSWNEYEDKGIDIAITVCDNAANEACPIYLNTLVRAHWGVSDPGHFKGSDEEVIAEFDKTFGVIERRVNKMLELEIEELDPAQLTFELNKIGKTDEESRK